jgi:hypothetical protein
MVPKYWRLSVLGPHPKPPLKIPKPYLSLVYWDSEIKLDAELPEEFQLTDAEFALRDMPVPTIGSCDGHDLPLTLNSLTYTRA